MPAEDAGGDASIRFAGVSHRYPGAARRVLDGVDLDLGGPRTAFVGLNGSGKSTLARMINGLVVPSGGEVRVHGLDPARDGRTVRRRVGFLFTDPDSQIIMPTAVEDVALSLRRRPDMAGEHQALYRRTATPMTMRSHAEVLALLSGFRLVEPGLVFFPLWRPDEHDVVPAEPGRMTGYAGVGRRD